MNSLVSYLFIAGVLFSLGLAGVLQRRNLIAMLDKYGQKTVDACINELLDMADHHMRSLIKTVPDGTYEGVAILEDAGHGFGDFFLQTLRIGLLVLIIVGADVGRYRESRRYRQPQLRMPRHLGEVRAFSSEQVLHRFIAVGFSAAEEIDVLL